jgi:HAMP domain-containing protein
MTNDIVKRLRYPDPYRETTERILMEQAADRIEALEAEVKRLEQQLKMARRLAHRSQPEYPPEIGIPHLRED